MQHCGVIRTLCRREKRINILEKGKRMSVVLVYIAYAKLGTAQTEHTVSNELGVDGMVVAVVEAQVTRPGKCKRSHA